MHMYKFRLSISWLGIFIRYEEKGSTPGKEMSDYQKAGMKLKRQEFVFSIIRYVLKVMFILHFLL